ncbi:uncharacterized protein EI90DRAFT_3165642 [Cantharellus anzutake]|uniref:uncharacterized protein n=1 Tax=Cantharellus anzutake TaxID=1750568 RepID=UPI001902D354|nr:uncharacterized protein EI90DRAFT_3165642 [Cantharellus anzutake]KAF8344249.1 hypothetical protein EI90DRAFT_3165642 [Cantharellus anzutake]
MVNFFSDIPENIFEWIGKQHCFWVATAPLSPAGHVNVSPKGIAGTFKVLDKNTVMYQDLSGSGVETIAHIRENGRITIMFQVREILEGTWHEVGTPEFKKLIPDEERIPGSRAAIYVKLHSVSTSCGYAVPIYEFSHHRNQLISLLANKEKFDDDTEQKNLDCKSHKGMFNYWAQKNAASIDGLLGMDIGLEIAKHQKVDIYAYKPFVHEEKRRAFAVELKDPTAPLCRVRRVDSSYVMIGVGFVAGLLVMAAFNHFSMHFLSSFPL